jgi:hypothetical protein
MRTRIVVLPIPLSWDLPPPGLAHDENDEMFGLSQGDGADNTVRSTMNQASLRAPFPVINEERPGHRQNHPPSTCAGWDPS